MGDLNSRIASSNTYLKAVGRYTYGQVSSNNAKRLIDILEANITCIGTTRDPHPNRPK